MIHNKTYEKDYEYNSILYRLIDGRSIGHVLFITLMTDLKVHIYMFIVWYQVYGLIVRLHVLHQFTGPV